MITKCLMFSCIVVSLLAFISSGCSSLNAISNVYAVQNSNKRDTELVAQIARICGDSPLGSYECNIKLQESLENWQFSIEEKDGRGKDQKFIGECDKRSERTIIHVMISGVGSQGDGEWLYSLGMISWETINDYRIYNRKNGAWARIESPTGGIGRNMERMRVRANKSLVDTQKFVGVETINGQESNHYRSMPSKGYVSDIWISKTTGYGLREISTFNLGNVVQIENSHQNENFTIETPEGEK